MLRPWVGKLLLEEAFRSPFQEDVSQQNVVKRSAISRVSPEFSSMFSSEQIEALPKALFD
ncbi:hypothetical protein C7B82_28255 [Stenomitos frigidus ULC18]|uniref:Uncharacterized protein n=1 Tax=Stenomitos frigidus ULC18 TaxID=2107698 RepID=A0A2T1DUD8_9CYAN|nr:hypothetical protein C7B82_28255 [Stenomitos frigidus ULC18]